MKKIINGKLYNTETAKYITDFWNGLSCSDFRYFQETLYKTKKWQYFLCIEWWPMSKYSFSEWSNTYWDMNIKLVNKEEIFNWFEDEENTQYIWKRSTELFLKEFSTEIEEW